MNRKIKTTFLGLSIALASQSYANTNDEFDLNVIKDNLSLTGFVAPTLIHTTDNDFYGSTDDKVSANYMEIGLLGRYEFTPYLSFVAQGLHKNVGASGKRPDLDFAFFDYTAYQSFDHSVGIRLGKIKLPYGLHNDTRDVPFTRNRVFLPQSIYFENFRDSVFSQKGAEIRLESFYDFGSLDWNLGVVKSEVPDNEINSLYSNATDFADYGSEYSAFFRLKHTSPQNNLRTALSLSRLRYDVETKNPMLLDSGTPEFNRIGLSAEYATTHNLTLSGEAEYHEWDFSELNSQMIDNDYGRGFYVQAHYKIDDEWDAFVSTGANYNDYRDKYGEEYAQNTPFNIDAHERYTRDITTGIGYQASDNFLIRGEYSYFEGTSVLPGEFNESGETKKYWQMVALQASYRFDLL